MSENQQTAPERQEHVSEAKLSAWEKVSFTSTRTIVFLLAKILTLPGLYAFGKCFGTIEWTINYKRRARFARQMRKLLGQDVPRSRIRSETLKHFQQTRCDKMLYLIFDMLPREAIMKRYELVNKDLLDQSLAQGKGVYVALCHHGAHHVAGLIMSLLGYKVTGIRDSKEGGIRRYVQTLYAKRYEEIRQAKVLYSDTFPREIYRCFKDGYIVGSALDVRRQRDAHLKTVDVQFCGETQPFLTGTVQIALRSKAPILQGFIVSEPNFKYRLVIQGPLIEPERSVETPETLQEIMQKYADNIEHYVKEYPSHMTRL